MNLFRNSSELIGSSTLGQLHTIHKEMAKQREPTRRSRTSFPKSPRPTTHGITIWIVPCLLLGQSDKGLQIILHLNLSMEGTHKESLTLLPQGLVPTKKRSGVM